MAKFTVVKKYDLSLCQEELNMLYNALEASPYNTNMIVQDIMGLVLEHYTCEYDSDPYPIEPNEYEDEDEDEDEDMPF